MEKSRFGVTPDMVAVLRNHLLAQYEGIFDDAVIELHISEYVDTAMAEDFALFLRDEGLVGCRMLDIGSGYGSNVLAAREQGLDAVGVELESFEVDFARKRISLCRPGDLAEDVFRQGNAMELPFEDGVMDVVTIMNVLEHVPDYRRVLCEASRVLKPGGRLYLVCPNYAAFRKEAHYHVPWVPFFPRKLAAGYLRALGRNSRFFEECIHYCTNWGILAQLGRLGFNMVSMDLIKVSRPEMIRSVLTRRILEGLSRARLLWLLRLWLRVGFYNPFKQSVSVAAVRAAGGVSQ